MVNDLKTNKTRILLFSLRLFFYYSVLVLIAIHPSIIISFDRVGIMQWFVVIPLEAVIAFLPLPLCKKFTAAGSIALLFSIAAGGFTTDALLLLLAGVTSFLLAFFLFNRNVYVRQRWGKLSVLEIFFLVWLCLRLLALSRSDEDIAVTNAMLAQFVFVWTGIVFLFYSLIVYFCLYPKSYVHMKKEGLLLFIGTLLAFVVIFILLPPDFIQNNIVKNLNVNEIPQLIKNSDDGKQIESSGRRERMSDNKGSQQQLLGQRNWQNIPEGNRTRNENDDGTSQDNRQYMVMVVASEKEPVYMGDTFLGQLDPIHGFQISSEEPLNKIFGQRFFTTWFNNGLISDIGRELQSVFSLSTLSNNYFAWNPVSIDPTIINENSGPLRYIHQIDSLTHAGDPLELIYIPSREFSEFEKRNLAPYFELALEQSDKDFFRAYVDNVITDWQSKRNENSSIPQMNMYLENIFALLTSFSAYQYNLSYNDDASVAVIKDFLFTSAEGDCVEFSNALALLGRFAGIPSRVVTGYVAAESLQTPAHLQGLANLQEKISVLRQFPFDNLFMVTNLHKHSWTQFYIPDYGWLDFDATSFAIPPMGMGDFNSWDVVIPIIEDEGLVTQVRKFPWQLVLRVIISSLVLIIFIAYILRYGREIFLLYKIQHGGREGARALYILLLMKLAADGKPIKPASKTALEYADLFPGDIDDDHFKKFALLYAELRWRQFADKTKEDECFSSLRQEYFAILKAFRGKGFFHILKRYISLKGLGYL